MKQTKWIALLLALVLTAGLLSACSAKPAESAAQSSTSSENTPAPSSEPVNSEKTSEPASSEEASEPDSSEEASEPESSEEENAKEYKVEELVKSALEINVTTESGKTVSIPVPYLDLPGAEALNQKISDDYDFRTGGHYFYEEVTPYTAQIQKEILQIVPDFDTISMGGPEKSTQYFFDLKTGRVPTTLEILDRFGITEAQAREKLTENLTEHYASLREAIPVESEKPRLDAHVASIADLDLNTLSARFLNKSDSQEEGLYLAIDALNLAGPATTERSVFLCPFEAPQE